MRTLLAPVFLGSTLALAGLPAGADGRPHGITYNVTVTNLTAGESFTPFLVASHRDANDLLFSAGAAPSDALAALAEGGDTGPLQAILDADPNVNATTTSTGLLDPGQSVTIPITLRQGRDHISLAAMLIPTNDGFVSLQDIAAPYGRGKKTLYAPAYDAGSEPNDELCVAIPGPVCGGAGGSPGVGGEGFVHIHPGIHGIGDLVPAERDWRNPVAKIVIERAR
jgi:hypothetical protein